MKHLAHNIVILRENLGLTQDQLAVKIGSKRGAVAQWELGANYPREIKITKLSKLAGVTEHEFKNSPLRLKNATSDKKENEKEGIFRMNFKRQYPYTKASGELSMNSLILLSIDELVKLQSEQEDVEMVKAITQVIQYKQYAESLERENKTLRDFIEHLKKTK